MKKPASFPNLYNSDDLSEAVFFVKTHMSPSAIEVIKEEIRNDPARQYPAGITAGNVVNDDVRSTLIKRVPLSSWVTAMLASYVQEVNRRHFHFDLTTWAAEVCHLHYRENDHYKAWHRDLLQSSEIEGEVRKLSIVMGLTDPDEYEGGYLQFYSINQHVSVKLELGQIVIFPTTLPHRVTRVKSGERETLIGWYGGPPFK